MNEFYILHDNSTFSFYNEVENIIVHNIQTKLISNTLLKKLGERTF